MKRKRNKHAGSYRWLDENGHVQSVKIADPAVKPRGTTVKKIRAAVSAARKAAAAR